MRERPKKANRTIFMGADFEVDLRSGGAMTWSGPGKDGKPMRYVVTNDGFEEDDQAYAQNADGWPRILSRLKTLLETGKTFRPH